MQYLCRRYEVPLKSVYSEVAQPGAGAADSGSFARDLLDKAVRGEYIADDEAPVFASHGELADLCAVASETLRAIRRSLKPCEMAAICSRPK